MSACRDEARREKFGGKHSGECRINDAKTSQVKKRESKRVQHVHYRSKAVCVCSNERRRNRETSKEMQHYIGSYRTQRASTFTLTSESSLRKSSECK